MAGATTPALYPLTPAWQTAAKRVYDAAFAGAALPYGSRLPDHFLANRLFDSCLWSTDCSRILVTPEWKGVGLVIANRRANPASVASDWLCLQLLCVAPDWQRQGWGRMLLNGLLATAASEGKQGVITSLQWAGIWPGIPTSLTAMRAFGDQTGADWRPGEIYLEKNLLEPWPVACPGRLAPPDDGITPVAYVNRHYAGLRSLLWDHFSIGWQCETLSRLDSIYEPFNGYGLATTSESTYPGRGIWILEREGQVIGFCVVHAGPDSPTAFFGPIGLLPEWRGRGLGTRLLLLAATQAQDWGRHSLGLWTSAPLAEGFYRPLGFVPVAQTRHAAWRVG